LTTKKGSPYSGHDDTPKLKPAGRSFGFARGRTVNLNSLVRNPGRRISRGKFKQKAAES